LIFFYLIFGISQNLSSLEQASFNIKWTLLFLSFRGIHMFQFGFLK
jgi:hypothetical protein